MKVLIAYDGSECSDAAIMDLKRAGLPAGVEAMVLTVGEMSQPICDRSYSAVSAGLSGYSPAELDDSVKDDLPSAKALASQAADRLRADFPTWKIVTETWIDSPENAIVRKAHEWKPDLIVLGSRGHSTLGRVVLGSVSQHVLHHTNCYVRISRHRLHPQDRSIQLLIAVDGSDEAYEAVRCVERRNWPAGTEARVLGVVDTALALAATESTLGMAAATLQEQGHTRLSRAVHESARRLREANLVATPELINGKPAQVILKEAESWGTDCIFIGTKAKGRLERVLLGSVADAVVSHAHCSVEIVRPH